MISHIILVIEIVCPDTLITMKKKNNKKNKKTNKQELSSFFMTHRLNVMHASGPDTNWDRRMYGTDRGNT